MMEKKNSHAQGTIEYLIVIAIVVVIALVVVILLLNISNSDTTQINSIKSQNLIGKGGVSVIDSVISSTGDGVIVLQNTSGENLIIKSITPGAEYTCEKLLSPMDKYNCYLSNVNSVCPCSPGQRVVCDIKINFESKNGLPKTETFTITNDCTDQTITDSNPPTNKTYTITFDTQGGPTIAPITNIESGETITLPENPTKTGYTFLEWNTQANGSGTEFTENTPITQNITIYAQWEEGTFFGGSGTSGDPYLIAKCNQLQNMNLYLSAYYKLVQDIDCSMTQNWNDNTGFAPVGNDTNPFEGSFDGNGNTISSLYINKPIEDNIGLFGYTSPGVEIKNLKIQNSTITGSNNVGSVVGYSEGEAEFTNILVSGEVTGTGSVGGLVGYSSFGTIRYCQSSANINGTDKTGGLIGLGNTINLKDSNSSGEIIGIDNVGGILGKADNASIIEKVNSSSNVTGSMFVGGIIGNLYNSSSLNEVYSTGIINSTNSYTGGIAGLTGTDYTHYTYNLRGLIRNCYFTGEVLSNSSYVGGAVGSLQRTDLYNCHSTGIVTANPSSTELVVGGLIGGKGTGSYLGTVSNSYYNIDTSTKSDNTGKGTSLTTAQMKQSSNYSGWDFSTTWNITNGTTYPYLRNNPQSPLPQ